MKTLSTALVTSLLVASGLCAKLAPTQTIYGQCGGKTWDGPTACQTGTSCNPNSEWFSQCLDPAGIAAAQSSAAADTDTNDNNNNNNNDNDNNPPASLPSGFRGGHGRGPPGGRPGGGGGRGGGRFRPPPGFTSSSVQPPAYTPPPNSGNAGNNGGNNGGNGGGSDDDGDTVVTQTLTTIFNVGSATISTQITYLTSAPQA